MILLEIILCITSTRFIKEWAIQVSMGATLASIAVLPAQAAEPKDADADSARPGEVRRATGAALHQVTWTGGTMVCDGCNVREPFEHRCHSDDGAGVITVRGEILGRVSAIECTCPECWDIRHGAAEQTPEPVIIHCPKCHLQHIDTDDETGAWATSRYHRKHLCKKSDGGCGHIWKPANIYTVGVLTLPN